MHVFNSTSTTKYAEIIR